MNGIRRRKTDKLTTIVAMAMKTISKKLRIAEKDNNSWHLGAVKGNINEIIFKVTEVTSRKLEITTLKRRNNYL